MIFRISAYTAHQSGLMLWYCALNDLERLVITWVQVLGSYLYYSGGVS